MASIEDKRRRRDDFLIELYHRAESAQGTLTMVEESEIAKALGIDDDEADAISRYLVDQGYATYPVMGAVVSITAAGVNRAEELIEEREQIAQAAVGVLLTAEEQQDLEALVRPLRAALDRGEIPLEGDDLAEFDADVRALETQIRSPRAKRDIVRSALASVATFCNKPIVAGMLSSTVVTGVVELLHRIH